MSWERKQALNRVTGNKRSADVPESAFISHGVPVFLDDPAYLEQLTSYFHSLTAVSRGDSARGRGVQVLHFLNFVWSHPRMPLHNFRPHRKPSAFLAMVVDLYSDLLYRHTELFLEGRSQEVERSLKRCLQAPWGEFCSGLRAHGLTRCADVLDEVVTSASRNPNSSDLPAELGRLDLYMTPTQLTKFSRSAFLDKLPLYRVFRHLRFQPPSLWEVKREQHPVGGDIRSAIRESYDALWAGVVGRAADPDFVTLFAMLPVNSLALFATTYAFQDEDFAVFYARLTDARKPGRRWSPQRAYIGETSEDWTHFLFLTAGDKRDGYLRKAQQLNRIGLSSTFPRTTEVFDAWLETAERFPELHTRSLWQRALDRHKHDIADMRYRFFVQLAEEAAARHGKL